jgi:glycosyltransferase involved in cell wall biosynthesis
MKVLIVCSGKPSNPKWSFELTRSYIYEQSESLKDLGIEYDTYFIEGNGILGYIKNYSSMMKKIKSYSPNLIHAHYGLSGLLATFQGKVPVVTTFHGSDINIKRNRPFSYLASKLSAENIFVHENQPSKINYKDTLHLIPCGVDRKIFFSIDKNEARKRLKLDANQKYGLFAGSFDNVVKNYPLAKEAIAISKNTIELLELKNYTRKEVCLLMNAVDFLLMTSFSEGSPLVIKEAMCCNCPIASVDVGDVKNVIFKTEGCYLSSYNFNELSKCIDNIFELNKRTNGRKDIEEFSLEKTALKIVQVYNKVIKNN